MEQIMIAREITFKDEKAKKEWDALCKETVSIPDQLAINFASRLSVYIQREIERGRVLDEVIAAQSKLADITGINRDVKQAAYELLVKYWIHGPELEAYLQASK